jgi:hypothetical protein
MKYNRKSKSVEAIVWDGINLEKVKIFAPKLTCARIFEEDKHLFFMNEYYHMHTAKIGDYIVKDDIHTYVISKKIFENEYNI